MSDITYYHITNRLIEEYFVSDGITKESNLLSAFFLINLIDYARIKKENIDQFNDINHLLMLAVSNFRKKNTNLGNHYLKIASNMNEKNLSVLTTKLGELDPAIREAMSSNVNFDFTEGYIGVIEESW